MKLIFLLLITLTVIWEVNALFRLKRNVRPSSISRSRSPVRQYTFRQKLDHFSEDEPQYWKQAVYGNSEFVRDKDHPNFLLVGGEAPALKEDLHHDAWYHYAKQFGADMYILEHRYYGKSKPTSDTSLENLKYLTSKQALADLANFINATNNAKGFTDKNKWILFGASYPGLLAAWARLHYPDQVYAAVSSSAPLQLQADYTGYFDVVRDAFNLFSPGCADVITEAVTDMKNMMSDDTLRQKLLKKFNMCDNLNVSNWKDVATFFRDVTFSTGNIAQNNMQEVDLNIDEVCNEVLMVEDLGSPIDRLVMLRQFEDYLGDYGGDYYGDDYGDYYGDNYGDDQGQKQHCATASFENDYGFFRNIHWNSQASQGGSRQYLYQLCNEFGLFETSETSSSFLLDTLPYKFHQELCTYVFGENFNEQQMKEAVDRTNEANQGTDINVTNVVFIQNSADPWHLLGQVKNPTDSSPYFLINGTSHGYDMISPKPGDSESVKQARALTIDYLKKWLTS